MLPRLLVFLAAGCGPGPDVGVAPIVDGPAFFDRPFPWDARRVDGHPDLGGFPGEGSFPIVDAYLAAAGAIDGFGTNAPLYVRFAAPIDASLLPSPEASLGLDAPVMLLDVDPDSPHRGERVPLRFSWTTEATAFQPENFLAAAPVFGFPLRPSTTYALVLRPPLAAPVGQRWGVGGDSALRDVEATLRGLGLDPDAVALAVPFTTQDPLRETQRIARAIREEIGIPALDQEVELFVERSAYIAYEGTIAVPVWQHGERPYRASGGGFVFDAGGNPEMAYWERVAFAVTIPRGDMPADGWPVVLYSHGTGGDHTTFCATGAAEEEGTVLARAGVAVIGISQPLQGDRAPPGTSADLDSFNFTNPDAGRTNFRQGALDQVYLAEVLSRAPVVLTHEDQTFRLDPDRVAFFGHSQGGLVGALGAPFMSDRLRAAGFSGAGGGLSMTIVLRKDPLDIAAVLASALGFDDDETLDTFHPVVGLVQMLSEATDPLNAAPYWFAEAPGWDAAPLPTLLTEGLNDTSTPSITTEALAAAGRVPIVGPPASYPEALDLRGLDPDDLPVEDNARDWNGRAVTAGLGQFPEDGHFAIYDNRDALRLYRDLLASALSGDARLAY